MGVDMLPHVGLVKAPKPPFRPEFWGAADDTLGRDFDSRELLSIEPYDTNVVALVKERRTRPQRGAALDAQLRSLESYLAEIRRAA